ncbi:MAG: 2-amino-4-hydroxy-6-hydroxymethyldihydropteridine diphosphokinase [Candidatus Omnitrophota bacterium]
MVTSFIAIGSNLGERQFYINIAIKKIKVLSSTRVVKISSVIETKPQGGPPQGKYLNAVVEIETELLPYQLLQELQKIESLLGRVRTIPNAPRTIDLDILTYSDICIKEEGLCLPHPRICERNFVLEPFKEIAPGVVKKLIAKSKNDIKKGRKGIGIGKGKGSGRGREKIKKMKRRNK